jgi:hypothetical protein
LVGEDDQHQRRWDDLSERARRRDHARGEAAVVAITQHDRQRDQSHRDHRRGDDASRCREHRADQDHRKGQAAPDRPEQLADRIEQVLGHSRAFEDQAHEREERDREQRVVLHDPEDAQGQRLQQRLWHQSHLDADDPKNSPQAPSEKATE